MLTAVDLDNQARTHTNEIYDVAFTGRLPPEVEASPSPRTKVNP